VAANSSYQRKLKRTMNRQRRMRRTLLGLVVSMTMGGAFLDWLQPVRSDVAQPTGTELIGRLTDSLRQSANATESHWHTIYIDTPLSLDSATGDSWAAGNNWDLVVDPEGRWSPAHRPQDSQAHASDGVFRIGLLSAAQSNEVTVAQWSAAAELLRALQQKWGIPDQQVILADTLAGPQLEPPAPATGRPGLSASSPR